MTPLRYLCLLLFLTAELFSCSGDNDLPPPTDDPLLMDKEAKLLELTTSYTLAGNSAKGVCTITEDPANRTITEWFNMSNKNFRRHHYDNNGNLQKIVIRSSQETASWLDSVLIKRPVAGQFEVWLNDRTLLQKVTRSALPGGGEKISVDPFGASAILLSLTFNSTGLLVSHHEQTRSVAIDGHNVAYTYDAAQKLTGVSDTTHSISGGNRLVYDYTVTADNASNSYLINLFEKLVGKDMRWRLYYTDENPGYFTPDILSTIERFEQILMIATGSVTRLRSRHFIAQPDGSFVESPGSGESSLLYNWQYDSRGRATTCISTNPNSAGYRGELQIKYFD